MAFRFCLVACIAGFALASCKPVAPAGGGKLMAFASDGELGQFVEKHRARFRKEITVAQEVASDAAAGAPASLNVPLPAEPSSERSNQITNTQERNVDEGGIVKQHGRHLVVLRRGRLFTIDTGGNGLEPVDWIDAFPPADMFRGGGAWYDEMLVSGDIIAVIGYSYRRYGTEINRFRIDADGGLEFLDSHRIRSSDYYSSRNYASRLIGDKLVTYQPIPMAMEGDWRDSLPGVRRWQGPADKDEANKGFERIAPASRVYAAKPLRDGAEAGADTFHSVTSCDLDEEKLACEATVVAGSYMRNFYVSPEAVYVWTAEDAYAPRQRGRETAYLYRMPLGGGAPQAIEVRGGPVDQFSFREDRMDGVLNVVVREESGGDAMWRPEVSAGGVSLLRLPLDAFGDGSSEAPAQAYRELPKIKGWNFHNRYVGGHLLYAGGAYGEASAQMLFAVPLKGGEVRKIALPHAVSRLDAIGRDGIAVGSKDNALGFSAISLDTFGGDAKLEDTFFLRGASEGENRSQAFFYKPSSGDSSGNSGVLALPVARRYEGPGTEFLGSASAILFLNRASRKLSEAGELAAIPMRAVKDDCVASCTDWYGNARPIFLDNRVFALMGYELVEGKIERGRVRETRRLDFSPTQ